MQKLLAQLYGTLAQTLANIMSLPNYAGLSGLKHSAAVLCESAKLTALPPAQPVTNKRTALGTPALAIAAVL